MTIHVDRKGNMTIPHRRFEPESVQFAVQVLNEALNADPLAVTAMFTQRWAVNRAVLEHPSIQVKKVDGPGRGEFPGSLGIMGLINGLFGVDAESWGHICAIAVTDEAGDVVSIERFELTSVARGGTES